jgi:hypothetical protein
MTSYILDSDELDILQSEGYTGSAYLITGPQDIIFAARANETVSGVRSIAQFNYDTVTTGAYTDILEGYDIRISRTNNIRAAYFIGRIRKAPTSSILYINESSPAIVDGDYVFVIPSVPVAVKKRYKTFFDWDITFKKQQPIVKNMDSAYVKMTTASTAQFSFAPVGQAVDKDATSTITYSWNIAGATYNVGSSSTQNITITVNTPYNKFARLTITDSNGTTNWFAFTITAGDPNTDTTFRLCHDPIPITADWVNGYSTNVLFWQGFDDVLDRTRVTVVADERFNGGTLDDVSSVRFVGYLKAKSSTIRGDDDHGQIKEISLEIASFLQIAGELHFDPIAIRSTTSPTSWDQISYPNPARSIVHVLRHSTLLNLCAFDLGTIDDTYYSGNTNIPDTSLMDAVKRVASEINAYVTQGAAGMLSFERDPRMMNTTDRDALPVVTPSALTLGDGYSFKLDTKSSDDVGSIEVGFAVFLTNTNTRYYLTANAPASGFGEGQGQQEFGNQLLSANSSIEDAKIEGGERTANLYAYVNRKRRIEVDFSSGWGIFNPSPGEWWNFEIDAADDPDGIGVSADERWVCVSKTMTINANGTQDTKGVFEEETFGGSSLIYVAYSPSVAQTALPVLPVRSVMGAFPSVPSINYSTTNPSVKQRRDPFSGWGASPYTPEQAAEAAQKQGKPGETTFAISFKNASDVAAGFLSVNGATYNVTISGEARVEGATTSTVYDFTASDQGWSTYISGYANYHAGEGWGRADAVFNYGRIGIELDINDTVTSVSAVSNEPFGFMDVHGIYSEGWSFYGRDGSGGTTHLLSGLNVTNGVSLDFGTDANPLSATLRIESVTVVTATGGVTYHDPFYEYEKDEDGVPFNVSLRGATAGAFINGATAFATPPPFNENHSYTSTWTGDGNIPQVVNEEADYSDVQNSPMYWTFSGPGTGS